MGHLRGRFRGGGNNPRAGFSGAKVGYGPAFVEGPWGRKAYHEAGLVEPTLVNGAHLPGRSLGGEDLSTKVAPVEHSRQQYPIRLEDSPCCQCALRGLCMPTFLRRDTEFFLRSPCSVERVAWAGRAISHLSLKF